MLQRNLFTAAVIVAVSIMPAVYPDATNSASALRANVPPSTATNTAEGVLVAVPDPPVAADPTNSNPFRLIAARNAFGIKEPVVAPPPVPEVPPTPPPVPSNVTLTGFSLWQGRKKVYLQISAPGSKAPSYRDMEEGDIQDDIEILSIDEKNEVAKIRNAGQEFTLNFKENAPKATGGGQPPAPGTPGSIPAPVTAGVVPSPVARPGAGGPTVIGRGGIVEAGDAGGAGNPSTPIVNENGGVATASSGIYPTLPTRRARTDGTSPTASPSSAPVLQPGAARVINGRTIPAPPPVPVLDAPAGQ